MILNSWIEFVLSSTSHQFFRETIHSIVNFVRNVLHLKKFWIITWFINLEKNSAPYNTLLCKDINVAFKMSTSIWQKKNVDRFAQFWVGICLKNSELLKLSSIVIYRIDYRRWDQLLWNPLKFGQNFESCKLSFLNKFQAKTAQTFIIVINRID